MTSPSLQISCFSIPIVNCGNWKGINTCGQKEECVYKILSKWVLDCLFICCTVVGESFSITYIFIETAWPNPCLLKLVVSTQKFGFIILSHFLTIERSIIAGKPSLSVNGDNRLRLEMENWYELSDFFRASRNVCRTQNHKSEIKNGLWDPVVMPLVFKLFNILAGQGRWLFKIFEIGHLIRSSYPVKFFFKSAFS